MTEELTEEQAREIVRSFGDSKANMHSFFTKVIQNKDTLKTGNLTQDELGMPQLPVRTYQELALFCRKVANQDYFGEYFEDLSRIQTDSSLSKEGFLMKLAVTIKKELADVSPNKKKNKGWFKKKDDSEEKQE